MTKPHSGDAEDKSDQPEGESAAVWAQTDAATEQKTAKAEKTGPVGGESKELDDTDDPTGSQDAGEADPATADDADDKNAERGEPAKAKSRISRARSTTGGRRRSSPPRVPGKTKPNTDDVDDASSAGDEELIDGEAKATADASATAGEDDGAGGKAPTSDEAKAEVDAEGDEPAKAKSRISWARVLAYAVLPALTLLLVPAAAFLKWHDSVARGSQVARIESVAAAKDATIALLSYKADTVEKDLEAAKTGLTGTFKESYSQLINEVVIPGAKKGHISATATVPAAASVSATPDHAVTLLFVNQTAVVDKDPPSDTTSSVRVSLDKVGGRWLISGFDPV